MTKEELEKEAKEYADWFWGASPSMMKALARAYIKGAEPREKRIAELEVTNKHISDECHKLVDSLEKKQNENELLETQNIKLQAEVSRLTIKNAELKTDNDARKFAMAMSEKVEKQLREENAELKAESDFYNKERGNYKAMFLKATLKNNKAKELLKQWLQTSRASCCDNTNIVTDTEQFLNSEVEK